MPCFLRLFIVAIAVASASFPAAAAPASRIFSMDQCADQYVLALAPRGEIVGLSKRALNPDSNERASAVGLPERRANLETILSLGTTIAVRFWTPDAGLPDALRRRGIALVQIDDASDFAGVRANIRRVAEALGARPKGEALIARLDAQLDRAHGAWGGRRGLFLTSGAFTAGPGTLVDTILRAAGLSNATAEPGFRSVSLERMALDPPTALVLGFFDVYSLTQQQWGPAGHPLIRRLAATRTIASLPARVLGCPAWFAGDAVAELAAANGRAPDAP